MPCDQYRAARRGRSRAEFQAKLGTVFEEADEAADWLHQASFRDSGIRHDATLVEGRALARIFVASIKTAPPFEPHQERAGKLSPT